MDKILIIIWLHWLADFAMQTDKVAINKSRKLSFLTLHAFLYSIPFLLFGWKFAVFNGLVHFVVDFFTSKLNAYYVLIDNRHAFFLTIGFDQAIHLSTLIISLSWLNKI